MEVVRNPRKVCSRIGLGLFLLAVLYVGGMFGINFLAKNLFPSLSGNSIAIWLINDFALYGLGLPAFLLVTRGIAEHSPFPPARMKMTAGKYLALLIFCLGSSYLIAIITSLLLTLPQLPSLIKEILDSSAPTAALGIGSNSVLTTFIFVVVIPAFAEEYIFRYLLRRKLNGAGDKIYILISGLTFALLHMNPVQSGFTFVMGMALAWVYTQTNNIWIPVSLHFALNFNSSILMQQVLKYSSSDATAVILGLILLGMFAGAIAVFAANIQKVIRSMAPPFEPDWPYKPPKPTRRERRQAQALAAYYAGGYRPAPAWSPQSTQQMGPYNQPLPAAPIGGMPYVPPQQRAGYSAPAVPQQPYYASAPQPLPPVGMPYTPPHQQAGGYAPPVVPQQPYYTPAPQPQPLPPVGMPHTPPQQQQAGGYAAPVAQQPYYAPAPQPLPLGQQAYGAAYASAPPATKGPGIFRVCILNLGMLVYITATVALTIIMQLL